MCEVELECLVDFAGTARWRSQKAKEFPEDHRNKVAESLLFSFAESAQGLEGSAIHERIALSFEENPEAGEECSALLRSIGFSWFPASAEEALGEIAAYLKA